MHGRRIRIDTDFHRKNTDSPQEIVACLYYYTLATGLCDKDSSITTLKTGPKHA